MNKGKGKCETFTASDGTEVEMYSFSDNPFVDAGLPDAEGLYVRAQLMNKIRTIIQHRKLTQVEAAEELDLTQGRVSELMNGKLAKFSLEKLIQLLGALGQPVRILLPNAEDNSGEESMFRLISDENETIAA